MYSVRSTACLPLLPYVLLCTEYSASTECRLLAAHHRQTARLWCRRARETTRPASRLSVCWPGLSHSALGYSAHTPSAALLRTRHAWTRWRSSSRRRRPCDWRTEQPVPTRNSCCGDWQAQPAGRRWPDGAPTCRPACRASTTRQRMQRARQRQLQRHAEGMQCPCMHVHDTWPATHGCPAAGVSIPCRAGNCAKVAVTEQTASDPPPRSLARHLQLIVLGGESGRRLATSPVQRGQAAPAATTTGGVCRPTAGQSARLLCWCFSRHRAPPRYQPVLPYSYSVQYPAAISLPAICTDGGQCRIRARAGTPIHTPRAHKNCLCPSTQIGGRRSRTSKLDEKGGRGWRQHRDNTTASHRRARGFTSSLGEGSLGPRRWCVCVKSGRQPVKSSWAAVSRAASTGVSVQCGWAPSLSDSPGAGARRFFTRCGPNYPEAPPPHLRRRRALDGRERPAGHSRTAGRGAAGTGTSCRSGHAAAAAAAAAAALERLQPACVGVGVCASIRLLGRRASWSVAPRGAFLRGQDNRHTHTHARTHARAPRALAPLIPSLARQPSQPRRPRQRRSARITITRRLGPADDGDKCASAAEGVWQGILYISRKLNTRHPASL